MTLQEAIDADSAGFAIGYTNDGQIAAEVVGPGRYLSKRKRRKAAKRATVWIWSPPKPIGLGHLRSRSLVYRHKLHKVSSDKRRMLGQLDWQPRDPRSAIDRLGQLVGLSR